MARMSVPCGPNAVTVKVGSARPPSPAIAIQMARIPIAAPQKRRTANDRCASIVENMLDFICCLRKTSKQESQAGHLHIESIPAPTGPGLERDGKERRECFQRKRRTL